MPDASTLTNENNILALCVGESGSGKKSAVCTFPHPIQYLDFDRRIQGLLGSPWVERKGINYKYYPPIRKDGGVVYKELNDDLDAIYTQVNTNTYPYKTIVLGSITGQSFAHLKDAVSLTHNNDPKKGEKKGKHVGPMAMADPADYGFQSMAIKNTIAFLKSLGGVHIMVLGHVVDRYGKPKNKEGEVDPYAESVVVGSKLSLTDKLSAEVPSGFNNIWEFSKEENGNDVNYFVRFRSDIARTTFPKLPNGYVNITRMNFYEYLMRTGIDAQVSAVAATPINK